MLYLGIDLGTSAVKLLLMDEKGAVKKIVSRKYPLMFPQPGFSEQNPEDWWEQTIAGIGELTADCDKNEIRGISFGGQMHGLVILDENDEVIRPAILWNDGRCTQETAYLNETIGRERLSAYTGNIAFAGFTAPKLLWLQKQEPEHFARIKKIMLPKDYLAYRLSGVHCTDYSDASGMLLLDVEHRCWSEEMLAICGVKKEQMPALYESYEAVGTILPALAKKLGLPEDCKIVAGAGDNAAAAVGTGTVGKDKCNLSLGTSGTVFITSAAYSVDEKNALHSFAHADGNFHLMGCILSAASCNQWWMEEILHTQNFAGEQEGITELGRNHVYFLPYLMGERSPHNDPLAKGAFLGMTMDTSRSDMLQAVYEGVAFALRDCVEAARQQGICIREATVCGGGAKSPLWRRILANVLNIRVTTLEVEEGPAYGAAILAAVACGEYPSVEKAAAAIVRKQDTVLPEEALVPVYDRQYEIFREAYPALKGLFGRISGAENLSEV